MTSVDELARLVVALERKVNALERTEQLTSSTVGDDADGGSVADAVTDASATTDALPALQDDAADAGEAGSDLLAILQANDDDIEARFADAAVDLSIAREELEASQQQIEETFGQQIDGLSDDVDSAITASGAAGQVAQEAKQAALDAAGVAAGKGQLIVQVTAPSGSRANAANLWVDITPDTNGNPRNTPNRYNPDTARWEPITDQKVLAAVAAATAAQATADGKPLILFSTTAAPSGTAPTGSIWFLWDSAKNIAGQWLQSGTLANPVWTPQQIRSEVIANLDVAKLTVGSAAIADLVAQKIAASTANFQTANVSNLFVTSGATLSQAVIDFLFANVVQAKKITAGMIDVDSLNGVTLTGTILKTASSGARLEILRTQIDVYNPDNGLSASIRGDSLGGVSGSIYLQGVYSGKTGGLQVFGSATETARTGSPVTPGGGIGSTNGDISATTTTFAPGYRAQQVMISPEFWVAARSGAVGRRERRAVGSLTTPGGYDVVFGAFGRVSYSYYDIDQQATVDIPVIFGADSSKPTKVIVQADEFRSRDRVLSFADSGWLTPSVQTGAGYSANTLRYRKVGNQVWWVGQLNRSSAMAAGTVGSVPAAYAPSLPGGDSRMVVAATATAGTQLRIAFYPDGRFDILDISGGSSTYALFHGITYLTD